MIHSLTGTLTHKMPTYAVVTVQGVGYRVALAAPTLAALPAIGSEVTLTTYLHVSETVFALYGFATQEELELFELLLTVSGIGPKSALGILSVASVSDVREAIATQDVSILTKVSGIGEKTAQRVLLELKGKIDALEPTSRNRGRGTTATGSASGAAADAIDALVGLGYSLREARDAIRDVSDTATAKDAGALVRAALRGIAK